MSTLYAVKINKPFGKEPFGGEDGNVDWGHSGENVVEFDDDSSNGRNLRRRPRRYRVLHLPPHLQKAADKHAVATAIAKAKAVKAAEKAKARADAAEAARLEEARLEALAKAQVEADFEAEKAEKRADAEAVAKEKIRAEEAGESKEDATPDEETQIADPIGSAEPFPEPPEPDGGEDDPPEPPDDGKPDPEAVKAHYKAVTPKVEKPKSAPRKPRKKRKPRVRKPKEG